MKVQLQVDGINRGARVAVPDLAQGDSFRIPTGAGELIITCTKVQTYPPPTNEFLKPYGNRVDRHYHFDFKIPDRAGCSRYSWHLHSHNIEIQHEPVFRESESENALGVGGQHTKPTTVDVWNEHGVGESYNWYASEMWDAYSIFSSSEFILTLNLHSRKTHLPLFCESGLIRSDSGVVLRDD